MSLIHATSKFTPGDTRLVMGIVQSKLVGAAERAQAIVKQEAEAIVPVLSGELALSIQADPVFDDGHQITATVSATAPHAAYVEFGTGVRGASSPGAGAGIDYSMDWAGMPAQPYLRPALDTARAKILEEFQR